MKILHADDHPMFREGLRFFLKLLHPQVTLLEAGNFQSALDRMALEWPVDLAIIDLQMPGMSELDGFFTLRRRYPTLPIVILSGVSDTRLLRTLIDAGARGYIPKFASSELLLEGLRQVLEGNTFVPDHLYLPPAASSVQEADDGTLTSRQLQILPLLEDGMSNKQIADALSVAEGTVKQHMKLLFRRLNARNRTQAVQEARRQGLLRH